MSGASGRFLITYHPVSGEAMQAHEQMRAGVSASIEGRESGGWLYAVVRSLIGVHTRGMVEVG